MEIEAKIPLDADTRARLRAKLGEPVAVKRQQDIYLQTAGLPVALRVRQDGEAACVTLKAAFGQVAGIKVREEFEPSIRPEEIDTWLTIFERLGLPRGLVVAKTREEYAFMGVHVLLDEIDDLGSYCEVEAVADDAPAAVAKLEAAIAALGLAEAPRVKDSYRELLLAKQRG